MKLRYMTGSDSRATLCIDGDPARLVTVRCQDATTVARNLSLCVNMHEPMVRVLRVFSSQQMGSLLVDVVVTSFEDEARAAEVERRLRALVNAVDVLMKGLELTESNIGQDESK